MGWPGRSYCGCSPSPSNHHHPTPAPRLTPPPIIAQPGVKAGRLLWVPLHCWVRSAVWVPLHCWVCLGPSSLLGQVCCLGPSSLLGQVCCLGPSSLLGQVCCLGPSSLLGLSGSLFTAGSVWMPFHTERQREVRGGGGEWEGESEMH